MRRNKIVKLVSFLVIFVALIFVWLERQNVYDWWRLRDFNPSAQIVQLATDATMNNSTRRIFYVQHPQIDDKTNFNVHCGSGDREHTIILGCYINKQGIYILGVDDERLEGIEQVTAAHELLHAAYDRLSSDEKSELKELINQAYSQVTDLRIKTTVNAYQQAGADVTNELHSILGTEVRSLPSQLEAYYKKYFNDRSKIVGYLEKYQQAFTERKNQVEAYDAQLNSLKTQIEAYESDLNRKAADLESSRALLDQQLAAQQYSQYNAGVPAYNSAIRAYNTKVGTTKALIDKYNSLLEQRNALALEQQELFKAIDSQIPTQSTR